MKMLLPLIIASSTMSIAHAAPITYDFTARFITYSPERVISGSFTRDGSAITEINLVIDSHAYTASEVGYVRIGSWDVIGGYNCSVTCVWSNEPDDFSLSWDFTQNTFQTFGYASKPDGFDSTYFGTITPRPSTVPLPASLALFLSSVVGVFSARRFARK